MTDNPAIEAMARAMQTKNRFVTIAELRETAQAAYDALAAAGFAVVPVEPTSGQHLAGDKVAHHGCPLVTYSAMIAAAKGEG